MILRESDWGNYPGSIVDDTTTNKSFIRFASLLKVLGVNNWYMVLALINPNLRGVSPFSDNLSAEQRAWIVEECIVNPWYYFRECIRIPIDGGDPVPFKIDRGNFAIIWLFFNNIDVGAEYLRQHGKTITMVALESYLIRFLQNTRTIHITKDPDLREETIVKLKLIRDNLPKFLWPIHPDDPDNKESFACMANGNKLITGIGQPDKSRANGMARGLTSGRLFSDEGPFTKNIHIILPAAFGGGSKARQLNEEAGVPYGNVIATTAGDLATPEGVYIHDLMKSGIVWDEKLINIPTRAELCSVIMRNSTSDNPRLIVYVKLNHRQLGTTDAQFAAMVSNASGTPEQKLRDYGGIWTTGGLNKPYSAEDARRMNNSRMDSVYKQIFKTGYMLDWYYEQGEIASKMKTRHIIGLDTSEAVGRDAIGLVMVNSDTGEVAAKLAINETNVIGFATWLAEFMLEYSNTVLIIERKSTGSSIVDAIIMILQHKIYDLHRRLYSRVTQDTSKFDDLMNDFKRGPSGHTEKYWDRFRKYLGFTTDGDKRRMLYGDVFTMALKLSADTIRDKSLIDEILALVERNGRIDHIQSGHDDLVIAWLLAMWLLILGKNLSHYEINNHRLTMRQRNIGSTRTIDEDAEMQKEQEQQKIINQIEELDRRSIGIKDMVEKMKIQNQMRSLVSKLDFELGSVASMESLKETLSRQRIYV